MPPFVTPFAPARLYDYGPTRTLGELARLRAVRQAEGIREQGAISGQLWANVGQTIGNTLGQLAEYKAEEPERQLRQRERVASVEKTEREAETAERLSRQDRAFTALFEKFPDGQIPQREILTIYGPQRGSQIAQGLAAFGELQRKEVADARDTAGRLAVGLKALSPPLRTQLWPAVRQAAMTGGFGTEAQLPIDPQPEFLDAVIGWARGEAREAPSLIQRDPTRDLVDPRTGTVISPGAPAPPERDTRSLDVQAAEAFRRGDMATYRDLIRVRREMGTADDRGPDPILTQIRELTLANLQKNQGSMSPAQFSMATRLADDYTAASKDYLTRASAMEAIKAAAATPSAAGDLALIFSYMRMLDPGSTVREGEFANAQNAAGIPDQVKNLYNRAVNGQRLNPTQRNDFVNQATAQFTQAQTRQRGIRQVYTERATRAKLNPADVVIDYDQVFGLTPTTPPPGTAPPAPPGWKYVPKPGGGWTAVEDQ